jgi:hypothetical protein
LAGFRGLALERFGKAAHDGKRPAADCLNGGDVQGRRDEVVAGLPAVDLVVGVGFGEAADDLVGIHVAGGAAAGLEDIDGKFGVERALNDLFGGGLDDGGERGRQVRGGAVDADGGALDQSQGAEKRAGLVRRRGC